jgi:hypothetical protein
MYKSLFKMCECVFWRRSLMCRKLNLSWILGAECDGISLFFILAFISFKLDHPQILELEPRSRFQCCITFSTCSPNPFLQKTGWIISTRYLCYYRYRIMKCVKHTNLLVVVIVILQYKNIYKFNYHKVIFRKQLIIPENL